MALIAYRWQASHSISLSRPRLGREGAKLRSSVSFLLAGRTYKLASSKYVHQWSGSYQPIVLRKIVLRKGRGFKVSSFKGNSQNEPEGTDTRFRSSKKSVQFSLSQQEREDIVGETPELIKSSLSVTSDDSENSISGSLAIKNLFRKWLILLQSQAASPGTDEVQRESSCQSESMNAHPEAYGEKTGKLLKAALLRFWAFDATIKFPLLIFTPFYLAVRLVYGVEVAKELMPLWVLGPLIFASYILLVRGICSLYIFCFKLSMNIIVNLPTYYCIVREGKLLQSHFFQPIVDFKNMDHREFSVQKLKQLSEWATDKRLDFIEAIWPYYCRTVRFLKRANLI